MFKMELNSQLNIFYFKYLHYKKLIMNKDLKVGQQNFRYLIWTHVYYLEQQQD